MITSKQRKVIKKPGPMFLVQCLVYGRGDKIYDPPMGVEDGEKVVCFDLASDGGKSLRSLLDQRKGREDVDEPDGPVNFADYYKYGDITSFDEGKFVQIFPAGQNPNREAAGAGGFWSAAVAESGDRGGRPQSGPEGDRRGSREDRLRGGHSRRVPGLDWTPHIEPDLATSLEEKIHPWPDIIKVPDHKTAASYLWSRMRFGGELKLDVLLYAWQDHPDWLPAKDSDVWAEWVHRKQVAPGTTRMQAKWMTMSTARRHLFMIRRPDRRPRQRAVDAGERAEDQPRSARRIVTPTRDAGWLLRMMPSRRPQRASRMVAQQEADSDHEASAGAAASEGARWARDRKPAQARTGRCRCRASLGEIAGKRAASDVAAAATSFRPSAAACWPTMMMTTLSSTRLEGSPRHRSPHRRLLSASARSCRYTGDRQEDPKDILAQARAKFSGGAK